MSSNLRRYWKDMTPNPPEEKEIRVPTFVLFKSLAPFIRPFFWMLFVAAVLSFGITFFELMVPLCIQKGLDGFILAAGKETGTSILGIHIHNFKDFAIIFALLIVLQLILGIVQTVFMEYTGQNIILSLRCSLFSHMTGLPISYFDKNASGRMVSRVAGDIENMSEMFTSGLVFMARDAALMLGIMVMAIFMSPALALYLAWLVPALVAGIFFFGKASRKVFRTIRQKLGEINHHFSEAITGFLAIQLTASHRVVMERFAALNLAHFQAALRQIKLFALFMPVLNLLGTISIAVVIWKGASLVLKQELTLGELVAFLTYVRMFFRPLRELSEKFSIFQNAMASAERIVSVLQEPALDMVSRSDVRKSEDFSIETVEFQQVDFSYKKGVPVLKGVSFCLEKGKSLGIAGHTGSGKSSVINLLTGFYSVDSGHILINGKDLRQFDMQTIRRKMALVMQDPVLFSGTVRENICPWGRKVDDAFLRDATEQAGCGFLYEKFQGLDTILMKDGHPLSAGEKQLVCIARAFALDPDLIIFDEATSYMDSRSESAIHKAMEKLMEKRLSIIVAHRLSTIQNCDSIILIRDGKIRERGSHQELADARGEYFYLLKKESV